MSDTFRDALEALQYIQAHDADARGLSRTTKNDLKILEAAELRKHKQIRLYGGPQDKDELISSILELRFPRIRQAREIHATAVQAHDHESQ